MDTGAPKGVGDPHGHQDAIHAMKVSQTIANMHHISDDAVAERTLKELGARGWCVMRQDDV